MSAVDAQEVYEAGLSEYERERLANIRSNNLVLTGLGLNSAAGMANAKPPARRVRTRREPALPERKSSRLSAVTAPTAHVEDETPSGRVLISDGVDRATAWAQQDEPDALAAFLAGDMPQRVDSLLPGEMPAYEALKAAVGVATKQLAADLGKAWVSNIAPPRSLCEMVRRRVIDQDGLRQCWGFGGAARAEKHGMGLLAALAPCIERLREVHDEALSQQAVPAEPRGAMQLENERAGPGTETGPAMDEEAAAEAAVVVD